MTTILGLDTSLAAVGWVVAETTHEDGLKWRAAGCLTTKAGGHARKGDDTSRRMVELWRALKALGKEWRPAIVVVEAVALPFGRTSMKTVSQLGRARALADVLAAERGALLLERSAQAVKKAATGAVGATKDEVVRAMCRNHPDLADLLVAIPISKVEHVADAAAVIVAAADAVEAWATWEA